MASTTESHEVEKLVNSIPSVTVYAETNGQYKSVPTEDDGKKVKVSYQSH